MAAWEAYPLLGYKTMKAALIALTQNLAAAHAADGVRVNAVLPGLINTPMAIEARVAPGMSREAVTPAGPGPADPARGQDGHGLGCRPRRAVPALGRGALHHGGGAAGRWRHLE